MVSTSVGLLSIPSQPDRHPDHMPALLVLGPATSASSESPTPRLLNQHLLFTQTFGRCICLIQFKKH